MRIAEWKSRDIDTRQVGDLTTLPSGEHKSARPYAVAVEFPRGDEMVQRYYSFAGIKHAELFARLVTDLWGMDLRRMQAHRDAWVGVTHFTP